MRLYLENSDAVTDVTNAFDAKADLVDLLESAQNNDQALSPIEVAALHMTMRQIDSDFEPPAIEQYNLSNSLYTTLALEDLKENIKGKWAAFIKAIKSIFKRIRDFIKEQYHRMKAKFKRTKAGDKNSHFKREDESNNTSTEQEEVEASKDSPKPVTSKYTLERCFIDMGDQADANTLLERLEYTITLMRLVNVVCGRQGGIWTTIVQSQADQGAPETMQKTIQASAQDVMDYIQEAGGELKGNVLTLKVSETVSIVMVLDDYTSFPVFEIKEGNEVTIDIPDDRQNYAKKLSEASYKVIMKADSFYKDAAKLPNDEVTLTKVTDPEIQGIIIKLGKMYSARLKLTQMMSKLLNAVTDIAEGIAADINGSKDERLAKEAFDDYLEYLDLAVESADKNKEGMWKKMVAKLKWLYGKLIDFLKKIKAKLRGNKKGKAGDSNGTFERGGEEEETSKGSNTETATTKLPLEFYTAPPSLFGWGDRTDDVSFVELLENLPAILECNDQFANRLDTKGFAEDALNYDDEEWEIKLETVKKNMIDYFKSLPDSSEMDNGIWRKYISTNVYFEIDTTSVLDYPSLIVKKASPEKLTLPSDLKAYKEDVQKYVNTTAKAVDRIVILSAPDFGGIHDEKAKERLSNPKVLAAFGNRAVTAYKTCDFISDVLFFGRTMVADIEVELKRQENEA